VARPTAAQRGTSGARNFRSRYGLLPDDPLECILRVAEELCEVPVAVLPHLGDDYAGGYFRKNGRAVILINAEDPASRMRFTLAHEIGHHYFKHLDRVPELRGQTQIRDTRAQLGGPAGHLWWEVQANAFAAEMLIPYAAVVRWDRERGSSPICLDTVVELACGFGTSPTMACIRLKSAGLIDEARERRFLREILDKEHLPFLECFEPFDDGIRQARENAPRVPATLSSSKLAAVARGDRSPADAARQLGRDPDSFAEAMRDLELLPAS
jgi:Zn-dependent peptidase ImmA (M78 family)